MNTRATTPPRLDATAWPSASGPGGHANAWIWSFVTHWPPLDLRRRRFAGVGAFFLSTSSEGITFMLGMMVRDKITGFQGRVTGYVQYLTGCNQALVQPGVKDDGSWTESQWLDDVRLEVMPGQILRLSGTEDPPLRRPANVGPDKVPPKR